MSEAILQTEAAECGLACVAMVARHHGQAYTLPELRQRFQQSLKGVNLARLVSISHQLGLQTRALRLELSDLPSLRLPCILHWDLNHFVVLTRVTPKGATVLDPARGERQLTLKEVSDRFTGVALEVTPGPNFKPKQAAPHVSVRDLTGKIVGLRRAMGLLMFLSLGVQICTIIAPFFMQWVVDQVLVSADRSLLVVLAIGFGLLLLLQVGIRLMRGWAVVYLATRLGVQWTANVLAHLFRLPLDFFEKRHLGDVTSRMGAVQTIQRTLTTSFVEAVMDGFMAVATLAMMLLYSWKLSLIAFAAVLVYLVLRIATFAPSRVGTEHQLVAAATQQSHLLESIRGIQSIKIAGSEAQRQSRYLNLLNETFNRDVWLSKFNLAMVSSASQLIFGIERIAVIAIGASLALENVFSVGMLIAYLAYKDQFTQRISALIDRSMEFRMLRLHAERLADIVLTEPEAHPVGIAPPIMGTRLEVKNLSFCYCEGEPWILKDCSLTIEPGESVAITGASGSGKTTLIKLMLGLLSPTAGAVSVGGQDIRGVGPSYRAMVGAVMQDDQLFAGSIAENIAFGEDSYDMERVQEAARLAAVHDDIAAMPMGYHSLVGDMGTTLSGGQKQRVILARALYRQPQILFLDEATSHLDVMRERMVNDAIRNLKLTKVIIAHRPDTIASADRILVMKGGRIMQEMRPTEIELPGRPVLSSESMGVA